MATATWKRIALVTGAASGIGRATAERLLADHRAVVVVDLQPEAFDWTAGDGRYVAPGPIRTSLTSHIETDAPDAFEGLRQAEPLGRWGPSDEVASVIQFLASPNASFVTGVIVPVDGGVLAGTGQFHPGRALDNSAS